MTMNSQFIFIKFSKTIPNLFYIKNNCKKQLISIYFDIIYFYIKSF